MPHIGDRDDWLLWHGLLGSDGRLPTPDLDGLTVDQARTAWTDEVFGHVLPATGHDAEAVTAIRTDDWLHDGELFRVVPPGVGLYLSTATYTPTAYLVTPDGDPLVTPAGDRLYVEYD